MTDFGRFIYKILRYKRRRGVYVAAQAMRRRGVSLEGALSLLAETEHRPLTEASKRDRTLLTTA